MNICPLVPVFMVVSGVCVVRGQTLSEALDTPDRAWVPGGTVTALNDAVLSRDGVDVVKLDSGVPEPFVVTQLTVPSVVEFWHRSRDLDEVTTLGINNRASGTSSIWRFKQVIGLAGLLEISNKRDRGTGPLYLDSVNVRPAGQTSLREALDWAGAVTQGSSNNPGTVMGLSESWLAPDGVDAVYFAQSNTAVKTMVTGPALLSYRSRDNITEGPGVKPFDGNGALREFTSGDRTWFWMAASGEAQFEVPSGLNQVVMDGLEVLPPEPVETALDAPGLGITLSGAAGGTSRVPPGTSDGDAVLCLENPALTDSDGGKISMTVSGPAIVRFSYLGSGDCKTGGVSAGLLNSTAWQTQEVKVFGKSETVTWTGNLWVNGVSVLPPAPGQSAGDLLNAPDVAPEFPVAVHLKPAPGTVEGDPALSVIASHPVGERVPVIRLPFQGPSVVSVMVSGDTPEAWLRIDGGPWQAKAPAHSQPGKPFIAVVPGAGVHHLEVSGPVTLDQFRVAALEEAPLAEALDAPGWTFTTSPGTPWKGYKLPGGLGFREGYAVTGGQHEAAADPWIETRLNGPGVLRFNLGRYSAGNEVPLGNVFEYYPRLRVDNGTEQPVPGGPQGGPSEILLGPGPHTVRWIQKGSQAGDALATTVWMDDVSFSSQTVPFAEALDTPGRSWTAGGTGGEAIPLAWAGGSPDGVDAVQMRSTALNSVAWVETMVRLPALIRFQSANLLVTDGAERILLNQGFTNSSFFHGEVNGTGLTRIRFSQIANQPGMLDQVVIYEATDRVAPAAIGPLSGSEWKSYDGKPWTVLSNPQTGENIYRSETPLWMEAVVAGPCVLGTGQETTLPDHGNRRVFNGRIHYAGPQRVLVAKKTAGAFADGGIFLSDGYRPALNMAEAMRTPGLTWSSGGDVAWISASDRQASSAPLWPGEVSWIEAELTGPGVLSWRLDPLPANLTSVRVDLLCDGVAAPAAGASYLHLSPGPHRVRWQSSHPVNGIRNSDNVVTLTQVAFVPQPSGSVPDILDTTLNFVEYPQTVPYSGPLEPWPAAAGWRPALDASSGVPALEAGFSAGSLYALWPAPGRMTAQLKMERHGPPGITVSTELPAAAAPFPWTVWNARAPRWPLADGHITSTRQVEFTAHTPVSVKEALDEPSLNWTADSSPPGLWKALTDAPPGAGGDADAVYLTGMAMGDVAWLETVVTGPVHLSTRFENTSGISEKWRILVDGAQAAEGNQLSKAVAVPAGVHRVRLEVSPVFPVFPGRYPAVRSVALSAGSLPDVNALLDAPDLAWGVSGLALSAVPAGARAGGDALSLGSVAGSFTVSLDGPGLLSFWMKGAGGGRQPLLDNVPVPVPINNPATWGNYPVAVPAGRHVLKFDQPHSSLHLDEFVWRPLPALTAEEALDAPAGVRVTAPDPDHIGAAAYPGLSEDGSDALLMMPGQARRLEVNVPPQSSISLRVRSVYGAGTFGFQDLTSTPTSTTWATRNFSTRADAGTTTIYLRASTVPVMIDKLTVTTPPPREDYFSWAEKHGLGSAGNQPLDDPDDDGRENLLEYSFGLNPKSADAAVIGTDTVPGAPEVAVYADPGNGMSYLEVRYWRRTGQTSTVETAENPESTWLLGGPAGWTPSTFAGTETTPGPEGWSRVIWRSPSPVTGGERLFVRVRYSVP